MEVFHCEVAEEEEVPDYNGPCTGETKPPTLESCRRVVGAWTKGAVVRSVGIRGSSIVWVCRVASVLGRTRCPHWNKVEGALAAHSTLYCNTASEKYAGRNN